MPESITCPKCRHRGSLPDGVRPMHLSCPRCHTRLRLKAPPPPPAPILPLVPIAASLVVVAALSGIGFYLLRRAPHPPEPPPVVATAPGPLSPPPIPPTSPAPGAPLVASPPPESKPSVQQQTELPPETIPIPSPVTTTEPPSPMPAAPTPEKPAPPSPPRIPDIATLEIPGWNGEYHRFTRRWTFTRGEVAFRLGLMLEEVKDAEQCASRIRRGDLADVPEDDYVFTHFTAKNATLDGFEVKGTTLFKANPAIKRHGIVVVRHIEGLRLVGSAQGLMTEAVRDEVAAAIRQARFGKGLSPGP